MVINKILNKLKKPKETEEKVDEEEIPEIEVEEDDSSDEKQNEEFSEQEKILKKVNALNDEVLKLKMSMNTLKKNVTGVQDELKNLEESLRDITMLYEVVSNQVNPFIGESSVTAANLERLERMDRELKELRKTLDDVVLDLKILMFKNLDIGSMVSDVMQSE